MKFRESFVPIQNKQVRHLKVTPISCVAIW